jgi:hypothetical protein
MKSTCVGEWVRGPYATTTIEGFIIDETQGSYYIIVNKVYESETTPPRLKVGSVHDVPKRAVEINYVKFNIQQQQSLIALAQKLKQFEWAYELTRQFSNPFIRKTPVKTNSIQTVFSSILKKSVKLAREVQEKLVYFYNKSIRKGAIPLFRKPEDIRSAAAFDVVISTIVLAAKTLEGIRYIKKLAVEGDTLK